MMDIAFSGAGCGFSRHQTPVELQVSEIHVQVRLSIERPAVTFLFCMTSKGKAFRCPLQMG
jgi:hypothetical protein